MTTSPPVGSSITINITKTRRRSSSEEPETQTTQHSQPRTSNRLDSREGSTEPDYGSLGKKRLITKIETRPRSEAEIESGFDVNITTLASPSALDYKRASGLIFDYRGEGGDTHVDVKKFWVDMQRKTFTNWVNNKLEGTEFSVEDIQYDFADGRALCALIQQLVPGSLTV